MRDKDYFSQTPHPRKDTKFNANKKPFGIPKGFLKYHVKILFILPNSLSLSH